MIINLITKYPKGSIILLSFLVTFCMTLVTKFFTDQGKMKELKTRQKACQLNLKTYQLGSEDYMKVQKEMMQCSFDLMKKSMKPLLISMIPLLIFFWWIRGIYSTILPGWLWWYIPAGIISSIVLRKVLKVV